jgi:hypothetical protein
LHVPLSSSSSSSPSSSPSSSLISSYLILSYLLPVTILSYLLSYTLHDIPPEGGSRFVGRSRRDGSAQNHGRSEASQARLVVGG